MSEQRYNFDDILASLELDEEIKTIALPEFQEIDTSLMNFEKSIDEGILAGDPVKEVSETPLEKKAPSKIVEYTFFMIRYITTSSVIFALLLVTSNFSAYYSLVQSYVFAGDFEKNSQSIISSVEAGSISIDTDEYERKSKSLDNQNIDQHSMKQLLAQSDKEVINLDIDITPSDNRIVIPKIGKNIPLLDIKQSTVAGHNELNDIFMTELEKGVIRYPGSAKPGENGNAFVFGHSSNFPWIPGEYNDVFALLDNLETGDQIIVYYKQKKYVYAVSEKKVIVPGDISVLKKDSEVPELSVMTCWPIGTTLKRLVVTTKLVSEK